MPDLRSSGHLQSGTLGIRLELQVDPTDVLLSDFDLWHYVLNYWYLPSSAKDGDKFERTLREAGLSFYETKPLPDAKSHQQIVKSWERIFNIEWTQRSLAFPKSRKSIQACLWQVDNHVVRGKKSYGPCQ